MIDQVSEEYAIVAVASEGGLPFNIIGLMEWFDVKMIAFIGGIVAAFAMFALIYFLHPRISGIFISKGSVSIHTSDTSIQNEMRNEIEWIDLSTRKFVRRGTTTMMIIDPAKYGMSTEALFIIDKANLPLIFAAYENHHTRELANDGADRYITDKTIDIWWAVQIWQTQFPVLTEELCKNYVCSWVKNILIPNLRRACREKIAYYESTLLRRAISQSLKEEVLRCLKKNQDYIACIDALASRQDIGEVSTIIQ